MYRIISTWYFYFVEILNFETFSRLRIYYIKLISFQKWLILILNSINYQMIWHFNDNSIDKRSKIEIWVKILMPNPNVSRLPQFGNKNNNIVDSYTLNNKTYNLSYKLMCDTIVLNTNWQRNRHSMNTVRVKTCVQHWIFYFCIHIEKLYKFRKTISVVTIDLVKSFNLIYNMIYLSVAFGSLSLHKIHANYCNTQQSYAMLCNNDFQFIFP